MERFSGLNRHWPTRQAKSQRSHSSAAGQLSCCCALVVDVMLIFFVCVFFFFFVLCVANKCRFLWSGCQLLEAASKSAANFRGQPRQLATCDCREQLIFKSGQVQLHWLVSFYFLISCFLYSDSYETKLGNPSRVLSFTCFQWQAAIPLAGEGRRDNAPTSGATAEERYTKPKHEGADS